MPATDTFTFIECESIRSAFHHLNQQGLAHSNAPILSPFSLKHLGPADVIVTIFMLQHGIPIENLPQLCLSHVQGNMNQFT
jgi:hypothetical protein